MNKHPQPLHEVYDIIQNALPYLELKAEVIQQVNPVMVKIKALNAWRQHLQQLAIDPHLGSLIKPLQDTVLYQQPVDYTKIRQDEWQQIASLNNNLVQALQAISHWMSHWIPDAHEDAIRICLPKTICLDQFSRLLRKLHLVFNHILYLTKSATPYRVQGLWPGSTWIQIVLSASSIPILASMLWSASIIYKKIQECRILEQQIRALKIKNESLNDVLKAQEHATQLLIEAEVARIKELHFRNATPEELERIKNSITIFVDLIQKGTTLYPTIHMPDDHAFPQMSDYTLPDMYPKSIDTFNHESYNPPDVKDNA